ERQQRSALGPWGPGRRVGGPGGAHRAGLLAERTGGAHRAGLLAERTGGAHRAGLLAERTGGAGGAGLLAERPGGAGGAGLRAERTGGAGGAGLLAERTGGQERWLGRRVREALGAGLLAAAGGMRRVRRVAVRGADRLGRRVGA